MRKILVGLVIVVVVAVAVAGGWYWREREKDRAAVNALKLDETVFPKGQAVDQSKLSFPVPANKIELSKLLDYIIGMDFPECQGIKGAKPVPDDKEFRELVARCQMRLMSEIQRIREIRDPAMVPRLIELALTRTEDYGPLPENLTDDEKMRQHSEVICRARFNAIFALGEIGDSRAIEPLLRLVDEAPPTGKGLENSIKGCFIMAQGSTGEDYGTFTCASAVKALKNYQGQLDPGIIPSLLEILNNYPPKDFVEENGGEIINDAVMISIVPYCHIKVVSLFGSDGIESLLKKFQDSNLSDKARQSLAFSISGITDPAAIPKLRELLHGNDKTLAENAAKALGGIAKTDLIEEYFWMIDNGYAEPACVALGEVKDPATVAALVTLLGRNDENITGGILHVLAELGPRAKEAVPALINILDTCNKEYGCDNYAITLGAIGDERALPSMFSYAIAHPTDDGDIIVHKIGTINSEVSVDFLKRILANEGRKPDDARQHKYYKLLRFAAIDSLVTLRGEQILPEICRYSDDPEVTKYLLKYCQSGN